MDVVVVFGQRCVVEGADDDDDDEEEEEEGE